MARPDRIENAFLGPVGGRRVARQNFTDRSFAIPVAPGNMGQSDTMIDFIFRPRPSASQFDHRQPDLACVEGKSAPAGLRLFR